LPRDTMPRVAIAIASLLLSMSAACRAFFFSFLRRRRLLLVLLLELLLFFLFLSLFFVAAALEAVTSQLPLLLRLALLPIQIVLPLPFSLDEAFDFSLSLLAMAN